jgi:hypothetical protein
MEQPNRPHVVRKRLVELVVNYSKAKLTASTGQRNAVQKHTCQVWPDKAIRHACLGWIFRFYEDVPVIPVGTTELHDAEIMALKRWIGAVKISDTWMPRSQFAKEAEWIQIEAMKEKVALPPILSLEMTSHAVALGGTIVDTGEDETEQEELFSCE